MPGTIEELREISDDKTGEDATLLAATPTPDTVNPDAPKYHPVIDRNEKILVRRDDSTMDWKNYKFEISFTDGTRQEFAFTAKDDADAQRKVSERMGATNRQEGTFRLSRLDTPKEVFGGELDNEGKVVASNDKKSDEEKADNRVKTEKAYAESQKKSDELGKTKEAKGTKKEKE